MTKSFLGILFAGLLALVGCGTVEGGAMPCATDNDCLRSQTCNVAKGVCEMSNANPQPGVDMGGRSRPSRRRMGVVSLRRSSTARSPAALPGRPATPAPSSARSRAGASAPLPRRSAGSSFRVAQPAPSPPCATRTGALSRRGAPTRTRASSRGRAVSRPSGSRSTTPWSTPRARTPRSSSRSAVRMTSVCRRTTATPSTG